MGTRTCLYIKFLAQPSWATQWSIYNTKACNFYIKSKQDDSRFLPTSFYNLLLCYFLITHGLEVSNMSKKKKKKKIYL